MTKYRGIVTIVLVLAIVIGSVMPIAQSALAGDFPLSRNDPRVQAALNFLRNSEAEHPSMWKAGEKACYAICAIDACDDDPHDYKNAADQSLVDIIREGASAFLTPQPSAALSHEFYLLAIVAAGENPRDFAGIDVVQQLKDMFDGTQIGMPLLLNDDFWGIIALVGAGESPESQTIRASKDFILAGQSSDGGWGYAAGGGDGSDPCDTSNAIMALMAAGESPSSVPIQDALAYLKSQQNSDGGFPYVSGSGSDSASDARVIAALLACGEDPTSDDWSVNGNNAVDHALSLQNADGGFSWMAGGATDAWMTTYILPPLVGKYWPTRTTSDSEEPTVHSVYPDSGATVNTDKPTISASYFDNLSGIDSSSVVLRLDGVDVTSESSVTISQITYTPSISLSKGEKVVELFVSDLAGNERYTLWSFTVDTLLPQASPTPEPTTTPVPSPSPTPTPEPTTAPVSSSLSTTTSLVGKIDSSGVTISEISLKSVDSRTEFTIPQGTMAITHDGIPLQEITIGLDIGELSPSSTLLSIGPVYNLTPEDANFDPPAILKLQYDEISVSNDIIAWDINLDGIIDIGDIAKVQTEDWQSVTEDDFKIGCFDTTEQEWVILDESIVDPEENIVTAEIDRLTNYTVVVQPATYVDNQPSFTESFGIEENIGDNGIVLNDLALTSQDGGLRLQIADGTMAVDEQGVGLSEIGLIASEHSTSLGDGLVRLGLAYDLEPGGAVFDPPLTLTMYYDELSTTDVIRWDVNGDGSLDLLDDSMAIAPDDLLIAYYDDISQKWDDLASIVDRSENSVTTEVNHFTTFAIVGKAAEPLIVKSITADPSEIALGDEVNFILTVENTGDARGTYIVPVKIDAVLEYVEEITVIPGEHEYVVTHKEPYAGSHEVEAKGVSTQFVVSDSPIGKQNWWNSVDVIFNGYIIIAVICLVIIVAVIGVVIIAAFIRGRRQGVN